MTTRHTISHADELYSGNAYQAGYSPDGRRGIKMSHLYAHQFLSTAAVPAVAGDDDGIFSSFVGSKWNSTGNNNISLATGALVTAGSTVINFDVPRNVVWQACNAATAVFMKILGLDQYGEPMAETIRGRAADVWTSGKRAFKSISNIYTTAAHASLKSASNISMGTGNRLGLPFHLQTKEDLLGVSIDGHWASGSTGAYRAVIGASAATTITTSAGTPDVRGAVVMVSPTPDGTKRISALLVVDHTTQRKAFGPPQVSLCSNGV